MTYSAAAYFDTSLVDARRSSTGATRRYLRILLSGSTLALGAVAVIGVTALAVTLAATWMARGVVEPQVRLPSGPASLALVPYDPAAKTLARAPGGSQWADAFIDRSKPLITPSERARPAIAAPKVAPARSIARSPAVPLPRPLPAHLAQTRAQIEQPPALAVAKIEPQVAAKEVVAKEAVAKPAVAALSPIPVPPPKAEGASKAEAMAKIDVKAAAVPKPAVVASIPSAAPDSVSRTAVYDITGSVVHMPDGSRLEAHSGMGEKMDDPRYIKVRMRGPTPPNVYVLTEREQLFHGVRAIRLNPVHEDKMFGRDGMLAHTYMLGPNGQSNGCISFKDYRAFLNAFLDGKVDKLVVVGDLGGASWRTAALQAEGVSPATRRFAGGYSRPRFFARNGDDGPRYTAALAYGSERGAGTW